MKRVFILITIIVFAFEGVLLSQGPEIYVKSLTRDNGLASNRVNCIYEDSRGFIWFGTQDGLNRFAGYDIGTFRHNPKDSLSISNNRITSIMEDEATGNFWVGTEFGLNYFDIAKNKFTHVSVARKDTIYALWIDFRRDLWVGSTNGLYRHNKDGSFTKFEHNKADSNSLISNRIFALNSDGKGNLLIGTDKGLSIFNLMSGTFRYYSKASNLEYIRSINFSESTGLWVGTRYNGLFQLPDANYDSAAINYTTDDGVLLNNRVQGLIEDEKGNLFIADRDGGLVYLIPETKEYTHYLPDNKNPNSLNSKAFRTIIESSTGIIWIGTYNSGVNYIDRNRKPFEHYQINFREDGLFNNNIRCLFEDVQGNIWVGTKEGGGLSKFDRIEGSFKHYHFDADKRGGLRDDYLFSINEIDEDHLIIGTYTQGIAIFNKETEMFTHFTHKPEDETSISGNAVYCIFKDQKERIWVGTFGIAGMIGELNLFNPVTQEFEKIEEITQVRTMCNAHENHLWLGTIGHGLLLFNANRKKVVKVYNHTMGDTLGLQDNNITSLKTDSLGNLWVGTDGGGLSYLDVSQDKITTYSVLDGLPNNRVFGVQLDDMGNVWLSSANGLAKFNPENNVIRTYDIRDGLQGNEFESYVSLKTHTGHMLFGGRNGFNVFHPDSIKDNLVIPKVMLTGFNLFYNPVEIGVKGSPLKKHISLTKKLELNHKQSVITFEFIALNYTSPEKNQYAYIMKGFDKNWNYVGNKREATYTNLPPGEYTFRVKASNNDLIWNEQGTSIKIKIIPPWWRTWWFISLLVLCVVGLIIGFYLIRMKQMRDREQELIQKVKEKTSDLSLAYKELKDKQSLIENQNKDLIYSEEYLKQLNEELITLTQQLTSQKEEVEETLNKLKATQNLLIQSEKMATIGILTSGIAHEINNPLNFIEGGRSSIEDYLEENRLERQHPKVYQFLDMIQEGVSRASKIVSSLNRFNHQTKNSHYQCNIEEIIDNSLVMLQNRLKYKVEVIKNYTSDSFTLNGNEGELHQVFLNILGNAEQAITETGEIKISTEKSDDGLLIVTISDTGHGIKEEIINKITEPFYTTKEPGKGTGLGLSITNSILKQHKATLNFQSKVGAGTTAIIKFPLSEDIA